MDVRALFKLLRQEYGLSNNECVLYYEIRCIYFYGGKNACYASNEYFESELGISSGTVKRGLNILKQKGLIQTRTEKVERCILARNIYPLEDEILLKEAKKIKHQRLEQFNRKEDQKDPQEDHVEDQNEPLQEDHFVPNQEDQNDPAILDIYNFRSLNFKKDIPEDHNTYVNSRIEGADAPVNASVDHALINSTEKQAKEDLISEVIRRWNEEIASVFNLAKVVKVTSKRKKAIKLVIETVGSVDNWIMGIKNQLTCSPFHRGKNDRRWKADFDYYLRTEKALKALEGAMSPQVSFEDSNEEEGYVDKTIRRIFENYNGDKQDLIF